MPIKPASRRRANIPTTAAIGPPLAGFRLLLEAFGRAAEQEVANLGLGGAAQQQAEHASRIDDQAVGRAGAVGHELLEAPVALERLRLALLLHPLDPRRLVVGEAQARLDRLDLRVRLGLDDKRPLVAVALDDLHVLERALPLGRALDVGCDCKALLDWRCGLDDALTTDLSHRADPTNNRDAVPARAVVVRSVRRPGDPQAVIKIATVRQRSLNKSRRRGSVCRA